MKELYFDLYNTKQKSLESKVCDITAFIDFKCNYKCSYCFVKHEGNLNKTSNKLNLIKFCKTLQKINTKFDLILMGGEPSISPNLKPVIISAKKNPNLRDVHLITNGSNIPEHCLDLIDYFRLSFHLENNDEENFIKNALYYKSLNKKIWVTCIYREKYFEVMLKTFKILNENKIPIILERGIKDCFSYECCDFFNINNNEKIKELEKYASKPYLIIEDGKEKHYTELEMFNLGFRKPPQKCFKYEFRINITSPEEFETVCFPFRPVTLDEINNISEFRVCKSKACLQTINNRSKKHFDNQDR